MPDGAGPKTAVALELASSGAGRLAHDAGVIRWTEEALAETTLDLMRCLGIPGSPEVTVTFVTGSAEPNLAVRPFRLTVNGRRCRIPAEDVQRVIGYIRGEPPAPRSHLLGLADVIQEPQNRAGPSPERMIRFLQLCCGHAMRRTPSAMLGSEQLEAYADGLEERMPEGSRKLDRSLLGPALGRMLALRISLADTEAVARAMAQSSDESLAAEELITQLRTRSIEMQAPQEFLDELFLDPTADVASMMAEFRLQVTDQLGLTVPEIRPVPVDDLTTRAVRFKINDIAGLPWVGLPPGRCMASAESAALELFEIDAKPALQPVTGTGASVIASEDADKARAYGVWVWTPIEHAILCLGATLRAHAGCLIDRQWVNDALDWLAEVSPELVHGARSGLPPRRLVGLLRRLVAEGLSIGDLPLVLDLCLEHQAKAGRWPVCANGSAPLLEDDDAEADTEAFVRAGMPRSVLRRWRISPDATELSSFEVERALEARIEEECTSESFPEEDRDRLLDALQEEVDFVPAGRGMPVLITSSRARHPLRDVVVQEFPRMGVLSRLELTPEADLYELGQLRAS